MADGTEESKKAEDESVNKPISITKEMFLADQAKRLALSKEE